MKRVIIILPIALLLFLLIIFFTRNPKPDPKAPRYVAVNSQPIGPLGREHYDWGAAVPFRDGRFWLFTVLGRTNVHFYFYDLNRRKVLGELFNAGAVFANQDQTKLLCQGFAAPVLSLKDRCVARLNELLPQKWNIPTNQIECFWILDLKSNTARRVGELSQIPGYSTRWASSPGFRFGFNVPSNTEANKSFFLCDLETGAFRKIKFKGKLYNWWSDHEILVADSDGNFLLFDVLTGKTKTLFTAADLQKFCEDFGLVANNLTPLANWNGSNYDFYFSSAPSWNDKGQSFLLKADKSVPTLRLFSRDFKFGYLGRMDDDAKHYVYNGESGATGQGGNGGVYVRDLTSNTTTTLVEPDNGGQYALPRFCGDSVLYYRKGVLWIIKLDGTGNRRLFPPPEK